MLKIRGPQLDLSRDVEDSSPWRVHESLVHDFHWTAKGHWAELERLSQWRRHAGVQLVVTLNAGRRRTTSFRLVTDFTSCESSSGRKTRIIDTTPSCLLTE